MANIGFVGLGHMGLPMACNLIKAGHTVCGFDLQKEATLALMHAGGLVAESLADVAKRKDYLITMLQTGAQVREVCIGPKGLFALAPQAFYIDCSTIDVESAHMFHQEAASNHIASVDAPVSGGVAGAAAASLTFMVGASDDNFAKARPILMNMGKTIIHAGDVGRGQVAKICNNMILGVSMIAISEAFILANELGLSSQKLHEVVSHSSGQCWAMDNYVPVARVLGNVPADNNYEPGFSAAMMLKDLNLSQQSTNFMNFQTPMGKQAQILYQQLENEGMSHLDFSAIIKLIKPA